MYSIISRDSPCFFHRCLLYKTSLKPNLIIFMPAVHFKVADEDDTELLLNFMRQFYAEERYPFSESLARTALVNLLRQPSLGRVWIIHSENTPVGYMTLALGYSLEYHGRDAFIDEFFVEASHRGKGIGALAMTVIETACREMGVNALHLEVERNKEAVQRFYRKLGFEDHNRYLMTKWIR